MPFVHIYTKSNALFFLCNYFLVWSCFSFFFFRMSTRHILGVFFALTINFILSRLCSSSAIPCPTVCSCFLDSRGRKVVSCNQGGLVSIPFREMDPKSEVIKISAPEYNLNVLAMDPALQDFYNLEELHMTRSNIPELGTHLLWTLRKLTVLNLSQNNITQPLDESFRGLNNLKELYLDDNRIYSLPSGTFRYLLSLKILSLQRNRIQQMMPRMFEQLGKLQVLKLSGNYLRELNPESFKDVLQVGPFVFFSRKTVLLSKVFLGVKKDIFI